MYRSKRAAGRLARSADARHMNAERVELFRDGASHVARAEHDRVRPGDGRDIARRPAPLYLVVGNREQLLLKREDA